MNNAMMCNPVVPAGGGGVSAIQQVNPYFHRASLNSDTWTKTIDIGADFNGREVWVCLVSMKSGAEPDGSNFVKDATLGGVVMTKIHELDTSTVSSGQVNTLAAAVFKVTGISGTSASLVVNYEDAAGVARNQVHVGGISFTTTPSTTVVASTEAFTENRSLDPPNATLNSGSGWDIYLSASQNQNGPGANPLNFTATSPATYDYGTDELMRFAYNNPADGTAKTVEFVETNATASAASASILSLSVE